MSASSNDHPPPVTKSAPPSPTAPIPGESSGNEPRGTGDGQRPLPRLPDILIRLRLLLLVMIHTLTFGLAYWLSFHLRFDFSVPARYQQLLIATWPIVVGTKLLLFYVLRYYHGWWRYVTFADFMALLRASGISLLVLTFINEYPLPVLVSRWSGESLGRIPRGVLLIDMITTGLALGLLRSSWRLLSEGIWAAASGEESQTRVVMYAHTPESMVLANQVNSLPGVAYRIVGLVCDESYQPGTSRAGIPILGRPTDLATIARSRGAQEFWVVAGAVTGARLRVFRELCSAHNIPIKIIAASMTNLQPGGRLPVRNVEIRDLLRREPVQLDMQLISQQLRGRRVMVTGAGGSIGSEICRQVLEFAPSDLILVDHRENSVFLIHQELKERRAAVRLHPCVGDILDQSRMTSLFEQYRPEYIYHAAAHKHVGMMELNAGEAVKNNLLGTKSVADLARQHGVSKFVLISTDKAVNPTSVMGASKQLAERYVLSLQPNSQTAFVIVRFGNVLGSNGSVVPIFTEQIAKGGPITVTDPRMKRFFMTIPEASQLVLQAASMGQGGEILVLDMGEQVPIVELAREMIRLSGLPESSIEIEFTGMRAGEKLYEELYLDEEEMMETPHPKIQVARPRRRPVTDAAQAVRELQPLLSASNQEIRAKLKELVPEFQWTPGTLENAISETS